MEALEQTQSDSIRDEMVKLTAGKAVAGSSSHIELAPELNRSYQGGRLSLPHSTTPNCIILGQKRCLPMSGGGSVCSEVWQHQKRCTDCGKWWGFPEPPKMADLPLVKLPTSLLLHRCRLLQALQHPNRPQGARSILDFSLHMFPGSLIWRLHPQSSRNLLTEIRSSDSEDHWKIVL